MDKLLLKPAEVGELTGIGKSRTYELIAAGVIPSVRIGKSVRVPVERLRRWIEELEQPAQTPGKGAIPVSPSADAAPTAKRLSQNRRRSEEPRNIAQSFGGFGKENERS